LEINAVRFFVDKNQKNRTTNWLNKLDIQTRSSINLRLARLEYGSYGDYKSLGSKLYKLRFVTFEALMHQPNNQL